MTKLDVSFRPHPVNGWWLRLCTIPYVAVDGEVTACSWGHVTSIDVPAGRRRVRTFIRYRRVIPGDLVPGVVEVDLVPGGTTRVQARNGVLNGSPFTPHVVA